MYVISPFGGQKHTRDRAMFPVLTPLLLFHCYLEFIFLLTSIIKSLVDIGF